MIYRLFVILIITMIGGACAQENGDVKNDAPIAVAPPAVKTPAQTTEVNLPKVTSDFTGYFSPDIAYTNQSSKTIPVYAGPEDNAKIIDQLKPGFGNFLIECTTDYKKCSMNYKGTKDVGWVDMIDM